MKLAFSIRSLLAIVLTFAVALAAIVTPRIRRQRVVEKLEKEPLVSNFLGMIAGEPTTVDVLLGFEGKVNYLRFEGHPGEDGEKELSGEVFESVRLLSPLTELEVEGVSVEPCTVYPFAEKLVIRNVDGEKAAEWLHGLLRAQTHMKEIEVEWASSFSDEHLEILCNIDGLESITLAGTSATGVGFRKQSNRNHEIELSIVDCPITDDGLRAIVECTKLRGLSLDFSSKLPFPDLRVLFRASRSLDVSVELGRRWGNPELRRASKELDDYFGRKTVHFEDTNYYFEDPATDNSFEAAPGRPRGLGADGEWHAF